MRAVSCVLLAACSFHVERGAPRDGASDGSGSSDSSVTGDARSDAPLQPIPIQFVQANATQPSTFASSMSTSFKADVTAGNCELVVVSWYMSGSLMSLTDDGRNNLQLVGEIAGNGITQRLYYATQIAGGANTVTATWQAGVQFPEVRVLEYSGIAATNVVDGYAANTATAVMGADASVGPIATSNAHDLVVVVETGSADTASTGYTQRISFVGDFVEDQEVHAPGSFSASLGQTVTGGWTMQIAGFRGAN